MSTATQMSQDIFDLTEEWIVVPQRGIAMNIYTSDLLPKFINLETHKKISPFYDRSSGYWFINTPLVKPYRGLTMSKRQRVARLVYTIVYGKIVGGTLYHLDGNRENCQPINLAVTSKTAVAVNTILQRRGTNKLTQEDVMRLDRMVNWMRENGYRVAYGVFEHIFNITPSHARRIHKRIGVWEWVETDTGTDLKPAERFQLQGTISRLNENIKLKRL